MEKWRRQSSIIRSGASSRPLECFCVLHLYDRKTNDRGWALYGPSRRSRSVHHRSCPLSTTEKRLRNLTRHGSQLLLQMTILKEVCLRRGGQRQRFPGRRRLCARLTEFSASDLSFFFSGTESQCLALALAHNHPAHALSLDVFVAGHLHDESWDKAAKACEATERRVASKRGRRR